METIKGYIERISFRNPQNGYTVMSVVTDSEKLTCVGSAMGFSEGETIEADGIYVDHSVYGRQFKVESLRSVAPSDRISVLRYLGSGAINGIGEALGRGTIISIILVMFVLPQILHLTFWYIFIYYREAF